MIDFKKLQEDLRKQDSIYYFIVSGDKEFKAYNYYSIVRNGAVAMLDGREIASSIMEKLYNKARDKNYKPICVTGDNNGIDSIAESYANSVGSDVYVFQADWEQHGRSAGYKRNEDMFQFVATKKHKKSIMLWNGEDSITAHMIYLSYVYSIPLLIFNYIERRWLSEEEVIEIQTDEYIKRERCISN